MGRVAPKLTQLDEGDIEIYHPECRALILITHLETRRITASTRGDQAQLYVEGICPKCNRYVYLALRNSNCKLIPAGAGAEAS